MRLIAGISEVCSSDLLGGHRGQDGRQDHCVGSGAECLRCHRCQRPRVGFHEPTAVDHRVIATVRGRDVEQRLPVEQGGGGPWQALEEGRSEEHTSELQSLMRISYAVCCLKKKSEKRASTDKQNIRNTDE